MPEAADCDDKHQRERNGESTERPGKANLRQDPIVLCARANQREICARDRETRNTAKREKNTVG